MKRLLPLIFIVTLITTLLVYPASLAVCSGMAADPAPLSFDELIALYENETPPAPLARKLEDLLETPFVENGAVTPRVKASRVDLPHIGPALRVAHWNIERGISFEDIQAALGGRDGIAQRLSQLQRQLDSKEQERVLNEAHLLSQADIIILNEVDWGLKRTGYRHVAKELAASLGMNHAFGVEFVEVDPLTLGDGKLEGEEIEERDELLRNLAVDRYRTIGLHGSAILSRYPLKNVRIVRFQTQGHDWFEGEKKKVTPLEKGKRKTAEAHWKTSVSPTAAPSISEGISSAPPTAARASWPTRMSAR